MAPKLPEEHDSSELSSGENIALGIPQSDSLSIHFQP